VTALDTNVLVRFLVQDDEVQASQARTIIRRAAGRDEQLLVTDVVACEIVWVLESLYAFAKAEIATTVHALLRSRQLRFQRPDELARALTSYEGGRGDFADYVIREVAKAEGADVVVTFDRRLWSEAGFEEPPGP
jgi:predicted nucleic-acid-binding protein